MNSTYDDDQPMGEAPEIDTLSAIERGAALGVLHAADHIAATTQLAQRQAHAIEAVRKLHRPYKMYDECDCTDEQKDDERTHVEINGVGRTCNLLYEICNECCRDDYEQSESCADYHHHGDGRPLCPTIRALDETLEIYALASGPARPVRINVEDTLMPRIKPQDTAGNTNQRHNADWCSGCGLYRAVPESRGKRMNPDKTVRKAAMMRWEHYVSQGVTWPVPWPQLTDAQKLTWLLKAAAAEDIE